MKPKTILAAIIFLSGSSQIWAAPATVYDAANSQKSLEERVAELEKMMSNRNRVQADLQLQLQQLQDEVSQVRGFTDEQSYKLEKVLQRQRELYQEIENRVTQVYEQTKSDIAATTIPSVGEQAVSSNLSENEAYDRAVALIMKDKRYDAAIPEFQNFLQQFPESVYIPNAHYWLGQLQSIKSQPAEAIKHFTVVVDQFPDSNKRPDAMLKLGTLAANAGDKEKAKRLFNDLIKEYPSTTAAKLATERLSKL
ncbi:tol-pal system protein YbgF [Pseudoalteromonas luteoviolacea]|uniref:tol-pal system protein YbgF n=1 Tax=Pseudoalteromonas luteoviolacea TaxID=43657 RepID=UPI0011540F90|nr:tol-pal system protein YbgF [Pseudoalteromonas luteoviolacea]TQF71479.1 tol-pal system protein YbgF [Pseudoalteromonas luteoviolacea]